MIRLEEIVYDAGRHAVAEQERLVAAIRQQTGTLLAAHALVASFLGATAIQSSGFSPCAWVALAALTFGLVIAAVLLVPWQMKFSVDPSQLHESLYAYMHGAESLDWLMAAAYGFQQLRDGNLHKVSWMLRLVGLLAGLVVVQTVAWLVGMVG